MTLQSLDWTRISGDLDAHGCAVAKGLVSAADCTALAALYDRDPRFRSRVVMSRHGYGRGEYRYFAYPLPEQVGALREALYPPVAAIANRWSEAMGLDSSTVACSGNTSSPYRSWCRQLKSPSP